MPNELRKYSFNLLWVIVSEFFINSLGNDSLGAETVNNWHVEVGDLGHIWVDMEGVQVTVESV